MTSKITVTCLHLLLCAHNSAFKMESLSLMSIASCVESNFCIAFPCWLTSGDQSLQPSMEEQQSECAPMQCILIICWCFTCLSCSSSCAVLAATATMQCNVALPVCQCCIQRCVSQVKSGDVLQVSFTQSPPPHGATS